MDLGESLVRISKRVYKIRADSNLYVVDLDEPIVIDTGSRTHRGAVIDSFPKIAQFDSIRKVIFTHLHYDHIGNFDLFRKAEFFASKAAIKSLNSDAWGTILNREIAEQFQVKLKPLPQIPKFKYIECPGHTRGSICIFFEEEGILFSGDTIFGKDRYGRTDLPTSVPNQMQETLDKLKHVKYEILAPGHDYCIED